MDNLQPQAPVGETGAKGGIAKGSTRQLQFSIIQPTTKRDTVLQWFAEGKSLNCFQAVRLLHDYVLRSTVSDITKIYGISFIKKNETVPGYRDSVAHCVQYKLAPEQRIKAWRVLGKEVGHV